MEINLRHQIGRIGGRKKIEPLEAKGNQLEIKVERLDSKIEKVDLKSETLKVQLRGSEYGKAMILQ